MSTTAAQTGAKRSRSNPGFKRQQILAEAVKIIGECGYNGFTISQLAARCNLTNAGLLHYFGSKEKLLVALLEEHEVQETAAISSLFNVEGRTPTLAEVRRALTTIVQRSSSQSEMVRLNTVLGAESLIPGHPAKAYFDSREARGLEAFTAMLTAYTPDPQALARQLLATMAGLEAIWLRSDQQFDLTSEWEKALNQLLPSSSR